METWPRKDREKTLKNLAFILTAVPYLYELGSAYQLAVGPLLYLYVKSLIDGQFRFSIKDLFHFTPFFFFHFGEYPEYFFSNSTPPAFDYLAFLSGNETALRVFIWHFQPLVYAGLLIRLLYTHSAEIKNRYSGGGKVSYEWMRNVFFTYAGIWVLKGALELAMPMSSYMSKFYYVPVSILLTSIHIYIIAYLALNRSGDSGQKSESTERYKGSQLSEEKSREYLRMLLENMEMQKSFTDPKLTLPLLASQLSINSRYLSQVINENLGQNFYDFVNGYRIAEAKMRLMDPEKDKYTIEAIAFEVGFNSKAAFYSTFKKQTKMTPSQFRESNKNKSASPRRQDQPNSKSVYPVNSTG